MSKLEMSRDQQFVTLVQTAVLSAVIQGEAGTMANGKNKEAIHIVAIALEVFRHVPEDMGVYEAADQFVNYMLSDEPVPSKPRWMIMSEF